MNDGKMDLPQFITNISFRSFDILNQETVISISLHLTHNDNFSKLID